MLADGIVQEEKLRREKAPEEAINNNWLPERDPLRNVLSISKVITLNKVYCYTILG